MPPAPAPAGPGAASGLATLLPLPHLSARASKRAVDTLFLAHAVFALAFGLTAFLVPHVWEWFMAHHAGETLRVFRSGANTLNDDQKVTHLVIRLYGALVLGQAHIVYSARAITEPLVRRALVQAYAVVFGLMTAALLRASLTEGGSFSPAFAVANISAFATLTAVYAYFAVLQPIAVFEGLGKAES